MSRLPAPDTAQREILGLLAKLRGQAGGESTEAFKLWLRTFRSVYGGCFFSPGPKAETALRKLYHPPESSSYHEILFSVHTHFALVVRATARRRGILLHDRDGLFDWAGDGESGLASVKPGADIFKPVFESLMPRAVRHALGEYYTPDWLAETILDETGYDGDTGRRLLDPSCGTGTFLVLAIERARNRARKRGEPVRETISRILAGIQGFEMNPLAALAARANYLLALGELQEAAGDVEAPIRQVDSILGPAALDRFDLVVGNPPWIRWDDLPSEYRDATLPLWKRYGLFSLKGFDARLGGGKKDLSMLFTYAAADRYLRDGGTLGFVITEEVFKTKGAGEGFRAFRIGPDGSFLQVTAAHDFTRLRPFAGVSNKTAGIVLTKGGETRYPVPYFVWSLEGQARVKRRLEARPMSSLLGPWRTAPADAPAIPPWRETCFYRAMLGANANPYGIFWLEILGSLQGGLVSIRNLAEKGKKPIPAVTSAIENDLVYPAVRGRDIGRWRAEPGIHVLVTQDPRTRRGYDEERMQARWPATYRYVSRFREELLSRALYRKYHEAVRSPFYSQFNVAEETFSPFKVVWKRMSNDLTAAVISHSDGPLGSRIVVPLETTAFIATKTEAEAHYLCAVLNSQAVRGFIRSFSSAGRGFGTPSVLRHVGIPAFDERNEAHRRAADLSRELHAQMRGGDPHGQVEIESEIERSVLDPGF